MKIMYNKTHGSFIISLFDIWINLGLVESLQHQSEATSEMPPEMPLLGLFAGEIHPCVEKTALLSIEGIDLDRTPWRCHRLLGRIHGP